MKNHCCKNWIKEKKELRMGAVLLFALLLSLLLSPLALGAQSGKAEQTYYESVRIESGDTLWSIALEYKQEGESIEHMIDKIQHCNQMKTTNIRAGENIIVPVTRAG